MAQERHVGFEFLPAAGGYNGDSYMEKSRANGQTMHYSNSGGIIGDDAHATEPQRMAPQLKNTMNVVMRLITFAGCITGFIVMITDKQTIRVPYPLNAGVVIELETSAKWNYSSAFVWFAIASGVVAVYSLVSIVGIGCVAFKKTGSFPTFLLWTIFILDLVMMNILMSALASTLAVGLIGKYGNSHTNWLKFCNNFGWFCNRITGALIAGAVAFVHLTELCVLDAYHIHIQHKSCH